MTKLKLAIIICGSVLTLATGAQAYQLRSGNGSFTITIPSNDFATASTRSNARGGAPADNFFFKGANG